MKKPVLSWRDVIADAMPPPKGDDEATVSDIAGALGISLSSAAYRLSAARTTGVLQIGDKSFKVDARKAVVRSDDGRMKAIWLHKLTPMRG